MFGRQLALAALCAGLAAALPTAGDSVAAAPLINRDNNPLAASGNGTKIMLMPARHPSHDATNLNHLQAKQGLLMYYDSDPNPSTDSMVAKVNAPTTSHPVVSLENTAYIQSIECTKDQAKIQFNYTMAYQTAAENWQQHPNMILVSYSPSCGHAMASGTRSYMLVQKVTRHDDTQTLDVAMQFVDYGTVIGNTTQVRLSVGQYRAPHSKRGFFSDLGKDITGVVSDVSNDAHHVASEVSNGVQHAASQVANGVNHAVSAVSNVASALPHLANFDKTFPVKWDSYPTNKLTTQAFGKGFQLHHSDQLDVICAGCGTNGNLNLEAEVDFGVTGISKAQLSLKGNMKATLALGLVGRNAQVPVPIGSVTLASIPFTPFQIGGIASLGPQLDLSASANVQLGINGNVLAGATLTWDNVDVEMGLTDKSSHTGKGLVPKLTPQFKSDADLSAAVDLSFPISLGVGLTIVPFKINKQVAIVETPGFTLKAAESKDKGTCRGVSLGADFHNNVGVNVLDLTTFGLESTTIPLTSTCLGGNVKPSAAPKASSAGGAKTRSAPHATVAPSRNRGAPRPTARPHPPGLGPEVPPRGRIGVAKNHRG